MAFSKHIWCLVTLLLIIFPTICLSGCLPLTTTISTTISTTTTTAEPICECVDACAAYKDERYDDCVDFCSYNEEPLPLCMCDKTYTKAKNRRVHAFQVDNTEGKSTVSDCDKACSSTKGTSGSAYIWTKSDCFCTCPNFEDLIGYGM